MPVFIWIKVENKKKSIKTAFGKAQYIQLVFTEIRCNTSHTTLKILIFFWKKKYHGGNHWDCSAKQ